MNLLKKGDVDVFQEGREESSFPGSNFGIMMEKGRESDIVSIGGGETEETGDETEEEEELLEGEEGVDEGMGGEEGRMID